jgi:hypothetical protein
MVGVLHHIAGFLAVLERTGRAPWARHWPLLFIGLAAFLFARDDPEAWPFGPLGFWRGSPSAPSSSTTSSWCWCSVSGSANGSCTPAACAPPAPRLSSRCWRPWAPGCSSRTRPVSKTSRRCTSCRLPTYRCASSDVAWDERVGSSCGCRRRQSRVGLGLVASAGSDRRVAPAVPEELSVPRSPLSIAP